MKKSILLSLIVVIFFTSLSAHAQQAEKNKATSEPATANTSDAAKPPQVNKEKVITVPENMKPIVPGGDFKPSVNNTKQSDAMKPLAIPAENSMIKKPVPTLSADKNNSVIPSPYNYAPKMPVANQIKMPEPKKNN